MTRKEIWRKTGERSKVNDYEKIRRKIAEIKFTTEAAENWYYGNKDIIMWSIYSERPLDGSEGGNL